MLYDHDNKKYTIHVISFDLHKSRLKPKYENMGPRLYYQLYNENYLNVKEKSIVLDYGILQTYDEKDNSKSLIVHYEKKSTKQRFEKIICAYKEYNDLNLLRFSEITQVFYV